MKRVVSAFLLVVVILGLLPIQASAAEDVPEPVLLEETDGCYISDNFALPNTYSHISNTGLADVGDDWSPMFKNEDGSVQRVWVYKLGTHQVYIEWKKGEGSPFSKIDGHAPRWSWQHINNIINS